MSSVSKNVNNELMIYTRHQVLRK